MTTDNESGNKLIVSGRSVESVLDRRIIEVYTRLCRRYRNNHIVVIGSACYQSDEYMAQNPRDHKSISSDARVRIPEYEGEHTGDNLHETICKLCELGDFGFKMNAKRI